MKPARTDPPRPRDAAWVLGALVTALAATPVLALAGAGSEWIAAIWLAAILCTVGASFVQALRSGLRHGDWSAFTCQAWCAPQLFEPDDEDIDWSSRTGRYAYLRIGARHEALTRAGESFPGDSPHFDSPP